MAFIDSESVITIGSLAAAIASAFAAVQSAQSARDSAAITREAHELQLDALLIHRHGRQLTGIDQIRSRIGSAAKNLDYAASLSVDQVSREFETADHRSRGGRMPRPLRHVLYDGGHLAAWHILQRFVDGRQPWVNQDLEALCAADPTLAEPCWRHIWLRSAAEACTGGPECIFGMPSTKKPMAKSAAIGWAVYDCVRRTEEADARLVVAKTLNLELTAYRDFVILLRRTAASVSASVEELEALESEIQSESGDRWRRSRMRGDLQLRTLDRWSATLRQCLYHLDGPKPRNSPGSVPYLLTVVACHHLVIEACLQLKRFATQSPDEWISDMELRWPG